MIAAALALLLAVPLQDDKEADDALKAFTADFKGADAERAAAVTQLASVKHKKVASKLGTLLVGGPAPVRVAAAKALAEFTDLKKQAAAALVAALAPNAKEFPVLDPILESLAKLQEPSSVPPLLRLFEDKDTDLAARAMNAVGRIGHPSGIDALIAALAKAEKIVKANSGGGLLYVDPTTGAGVVLGGATDQKARAQTLLNASNGALQAITGETHATSQAWTAWWTANRATFKK
jgi:HEAT repeat protein